MSDVNAEAADLCREAAQIIDERGWTNDRFEDALTGAVCLYGALGLAYNGRIYALGYFPDADDLEAARKTRDRLDVFFAKKLAVPLMELVATAYLNDKRGTTQQDVQKFLLSVADEIEVQS